jgi:hypothetical protein
MVIIPERLMAGDRTEMRLHSQPDRVISPKGLMIGDRTEMHLLYQIGRVVNPERLMTGIRTGIRLPGQTGLFPLRRDQGQTNVLWVKVIWFAVNTFPVTICLPATVIMQTYFLSRESKVRHLVSGQHNSGHHLST